MLGWYIGPNTKTDAIAASRNVHVGVLVEPMTNIEIERERTKKKDCTGLGTMKMKNEWIDPKGASHNND